MPGYTYVAVDQNGREKRGRIEAQSSEEVSQQLKKDGLFPVEMKEQGVLNKDHGYLHRCKSQAARPERFLPSVCQHYTGRCSHEGSPADDD